MTTTEQEREDLKRQLQKLKGEDGQYVISTFGSVYGLPALIDFIRTEVLKARIDERENMKFINESTGEETYLPFVQYRYTGDGLLLNWEQRSAQLQANQKEKKT